MKKAQVYAKHNTARISPKKVAIVMNMIRGMPLHRAKVTLAFDSTKASKLILKVLKSAEANATKNQGLSSKELYLSELYVNGARVVRTGRAGSKGRFSPIIKRSSHLVVGLSSYQEGKK